MTIMMTRTLFAGILLATAATASAKGYKSEDTLTAEFTAQKSKSYVSASATIDFAKRTLEVSLRPVMPTCPKGRMCIQKMPEPVTYELNNAKSTINSCGIIQTIALVDRTPVDGAKIQITVTNNDGNTCPTFAALPVLQLDFQTQSYNRLKGKLVTTLDRFVAEDYKLSAEPVVYQAVIAAELEVLSSDRFISASLFADGRKGLVNLTLQPEMPACAEGMLCAQVMPEPVLVSLDNSKTEIDDCGIIRTVAFDDQRPVDGKLLQVTVTNNSNNTCPTFAALKTLEVTYEERYFSRLERGEVVIIDSFTADDFAAIKPSSK